MPGAFYADDFQSHHVGGREGGAAGGGGYGNRRPSDHVPHGGGASSLDNIYSPNPQLFGAANQTAANTRNLEASLDGLDHVAVGDRLSKPKQGHGVDGDHVHGHHPRQHADEDHNYMKNPKTVRELLRSVRQQAVLIKNNLRGPSISASSTADTTSGQQLAPGGTTSGATGAGLITHNRFAERRTHKEDLAQALGIPQSVNI